VGLSEIADDLCNDTFHNLAQSILECDRSVGFDFPIIRSTRPPEYHRGRMLERFGKVPESDTCISASKWCSMTGSAFFRTLFEISSGPGALSAASRLTASRICCIVILASYGTSCGYTANEISVRSAGGGFGKKALRNALTFCSFVAALPLRVGTKVDVGVLEMQY